MEESASALASLLGPSVGSFLEHWPESIFVRHQSLEELPAVLRSPMILQPSNLTRVYRGEVEVTNGRGGQYRLQGTDPADYFNVLGLAARFTGLDQYLEGTSAWLRTLEHELGIPRGCATLNAFINPAGIGLSAHCDPCEHIAIQLVGTKHFRVKKNPHTRFPSMSYSASRTPGRSDLAQAQQGFPLWETLPDDAQSITLKPGSVLLIPRGAMHETAGGDEGGHSVTLVIQVQTPSYAQLVGQYLRDYVMQDEGWRTPASGAWGSSAPGARQHLADLLAQLARNVGDLSLERIFRAAQAGPVAQEFSWGARLQRNPALTLSVNIVGDNVDISVRHRTGDAQSKRVTLRHEAHEIVSWIDRHQGPFHIQELQAQFDEWDEDSLETIVGFLVKQSVLLVSPIEPYRA